VIDRQPDGWATAGGEQAGIRPTKGEDRLVRVAEQQQLVGARSEPVHQRGLQRVEVLGIVDDQVTYPVGLPAHHLSIGVEHQQRRGHQLSGVQRGGGGLRSGRTH